MGLYRFFGVGLQAGMKTGGVAFRNLRRCFGGHDQRRLDGFDGLSTAGNELQLFVIAFADF
jgi:hypothetical protein